MNNAEKNELIELQKEQIESYEETIEKYEMQIDDLKDEIEVLEDNLKAKDREVENVTWDKEQLEDEVNSTKPTTVLDELKREIVEKFMELNIEQLQELEKTHVG